MGNKKTHEQYIKEVYKINPNIEVIEKYISAHEKILHKCKIDGNIWSVSPNNILHGYGCPICGKKINILHKTKTHEQYIEEVLKTNPNIEVLEEYIDAKTNILHKCRIDGYEWFAKPNNILKGTGCPVCAGLKIGFPPEYKNSIWASGYKDYFAQYMTENQMKQYMPQSKSSIEVHCKYCGRLNKTKINNLFKHDVSCVCSDGRSYPNKFLYKFLEQLNIYYVPEKSFEWSNRKIYDIYIPDFNCIIENHGKQHYIGWRGSEDDLKHQQYNDYYKQSLAKNNGIDNYIVLDCRNSTIEHIKNSILKSKLLILLDCDITNIDWNECDKFASSNLVKEAANLWNDGLSPKEIGNKLNLDKTTVRKYLLKASKYLWCDYSKEESRKRQALNNIGENNSHAKKCIRLKDKKIFGTIKNAALEEGVYSETIIRRCKEHKGFMYYDEYLDLAAH